MTGTYDTRHRDDVIVPWQAAFGYAVEDRISMGMRVPQNITGVPTAALAQPPPAATE